MCDKFFGHFGCRDHMFVCKADDDTNHDYHLWSIIIEFKYTTHQEIMNEICFATVFVKIYTIKINILFVCHAKLCYTHFKQHFPPHFHKKYRYPHNFSGIRHTILRHISGCLFNSWSR